MSDLRISYRYCPQKTVCSQTKDRESVPNKPIADRLDPAMLYQFKKNLHTISQFYNKNSSAP